MISLHNHRGRLQATLFLLIFSLVFWSSGGSNKLVTAVTMLLCVVGAIVSSASASRVRAAARVDRRGAAPGRTAPEGCRKDQKRS